ncbi:MAG: GTPase Era [Deltaproteobacteria bacterium]|nr:GTPase Era [Deltaproteobacteria bacterium]
MSSSGITKAGIVALVGPANAGKSTLLNTIIEDKVAIVSSRPHTTRHKVLGIKTASETQIVFVDTPGFAQSLRDGGLKHHLLHIQQDAAAGVDALVLVLDAQSLHKQGEINPLKELTQNNIAKPQIVVLNKIDLLSKDEILPLIKKVADYFAANTDLRPEIIPLSAKKNDNVAELIKTLEKLIPQGEFLYPIDQLTDQAEHFFIAELIREQVFLRMRQEIPYSVAVLVDDIRDTPKIMHVFATIYVEKPNQKSIIIGSHGRALKAIGIAARSEIEKCYEIQVNLKLHVKVEEHWSLTDKGLKKVGFY